MDGSELARILVLLVVVVIFIIFILLDTSKAIKRKAHWVPSHFLVLSALIIQLLNLLSGKSALKEDSWDEMHRLKQSELWMIHSGRVMLCVVMAYLLPSMAARGSQEFWGKMAALGITILGQMTSELYSFNSNTDKSLSTILSLWPSLKDSNELAFIGSAFVLFISFVTLILLLGCANIASRSIQVIFAQNIPLILSSSSKDCIGDEKKWKTIGDEVLKAWIVARAYTPEYIIAKSPLSSAATTLLSLLIWSSIIGWLKQGPTVKTYAVFDKLKLMVTLLQVIFILIGWAIMAWRWVIAGWYYKRWDLVTWRTVFRVEDYWTRYIKDLIEDRRPKLRPAERLRRTVDKLVVKQPKKNQMPWMRLYVLVGLQWMLLYVLLGLQWITVLFSKTCWVFSLIIFHNKCTFIFINFIVTKHDESELEKLSVYKEVLKGLNMLGETTESLWIANKKSIAEAKKLITQGNDDGKTNCEELVTFLQQNRNRPDGIDLSSSGPKKPPGFKYLWQNEKYEPLEVEKQFVDATKRSWKMTAACLIRIIIQLSPICDCSDCSGTSESTSHDFPPKYVKDSLKAYSQAWEILDFVDAQEADGILGEAADTFFHKLQTEVDKGDLPPKRIFNSQPGCVAATIKEIEKQCIKKAAKPKGLGIKSAVINPGKKVQTENPKAKGDDQDYEGAYDSMNWKEVAGGIALYKLCKSIADSPNAKELFKELRSALADIIYGSITKAKSTLVENSRKWARDSDEDKIGRALYTTGKAKALEKMVKAEQAKAEAEKRDTHSLEIAPSRSEKRENNPPDAYCLEIVPSTS